MKMNKKGFTIVELVIVIVVIAILAAVLIPTFSSLIKKANISSDTAMAKNLNTILVAEEAVNGAPEEFGTVLHVFSENGYLLGSLNPTTDGCYLVWEKDTNQILLVELTDKAPNYKVLYKAEDYEGEPDDSWYFAVTTQEEANKIVGVLPNVITKLTILDTVELNKTLNSITNGETLYIDGGINVDKENAIKLDKADAKVTLDLGSSAVTGGSNDTSAKAYPFYVTDGELNLKNGVISATGAFIDADGKTQHAAVVAEGGEVNMEGTTVAINDTAGLVIVYENATGELKDVTMNTPNSNNVVAAFAGANVRLVNSTANVDYLAFFSSTSGGAGTQIEIAGGTYHAKVSNLLGVYGGTIVVEDGTFTCGNASKTFKFYNVSGGKIVLKGGTFNGIAFDKLTEDTIRGMCNLSECAKGINVVKTDGVWTLTVK